MSARWKLFRDESGAGAMEGVGLSFVGVVVIAAGVWIATGTRNNTAEQANVQNKLNYKAGPPPAKSGQALVDSESKSGSGSSNSGVGGTKPGGSGSSSTGAGGGGGSGGGSGGGTPLPPETNKPPYRIVVTVGEPPKDDPKTPVNESLYEAEFKIYVNSPEGEKELVTVRGTARPDDTSKHGSIVAGKYPLHLGFHKRNGKVPTKDDLVVKSGSEELRPSIIVNEDKDVNCESGDPKKTTMNAIHIHNGFKTMRGSEGCLTIHPDDWSKLMNAFLEAYPNLESWYQDKPRKYYVQEIGELEVIRPAKKEDGEKKDDGKGGKGGK
jgi:hypothetical protein